MYNKDIINSTVGIMLAVCIDFLGVHLDVKYRTLTSLAQLFSTDATALVATWGRH